MGRAPDLLERGYLLGRNQERIRGFRDLLQPAIVNLMRDRLSVQLGLFHLFLPVYAMRLVGLDESLDCDREAWVREEPSLLAARDSMLRSRINTELDCEAQACGYAEGLASDFGQIDSEILQRPSNDIARALSPIIVLAISRRRGFD